MLLKEDIMERTINLATSTIKDGNTPFGAIIMKEGKVIAEAVNEVSSSKDITAHAELLAIRKATKKLARTDLSDCELYASGEPCTMCLTAIYYAGIKTVYLAYQQEVANEYGIGNSYVSDQMKLAKKERDLTYTYLTPENIEHPYKTWKNRENTKNKTNKKPF